MIKKYKSFAIFKKELKDGVEVNPKAPTYDATASFQNPDGTFEKSVNVGSVWLKDGAKGKYFSGQFKVAKDNFPGFVLVNEQELDKVLKLAEAMQQKLNSKLGDAYPTDVEEFPQPNDFEF